MHPAIDESAAVIVGKCGGPSRLAGDRAGKQIGLNEDLKAVADSDYGFARIDKSSQRISQVATELAGEYSPGGDVVAVGKTAGDGEDLKFVEDARVLQHALNMQGPRLSSRQFKSIGRFLV